MKATLRLKITLTFILITLYGCGCGLMPKRRVPPDPTYASGRKPIKANFASTAPQNTIPSFDAANTAPVMYPDPVLEGADARAGENQISAPPMLGGAPLNPGAIQQ